MTLTIPSWILTVLGVLGGLSVLGATGYLVLKLRVVHQQLGKMGEVLNWILYRLPYTADVGPGPSRPEAMHGLAAPGDDWEDRLEEDAKVRAENPVYVVDDDFLAKLERLRGNGNLSQRQKAEMAEAIARGDALPGIPDEEES